MTNVDIRKLAELTRVAVTDEEVKQLEKEVPAILAFVEQVAETGAVAGKSEGEHRNIFREDENPHKTGEHTQVLLDAMPQHTKEGYLKVRKIIPQD